MYLRVMRRTNKDGSVVEYLQLAHNVRRPGSPHPHVQVIHTFGRRDQVDPDALRRLAQSLRRLDQGQSQDGLEVVSAKPLGGAHVLAALWERLGIRDQLKELLQEREFDSDMERVLFALVANRCLDPHSKLGTCEWVAEDVAIPELPQLEVQQAYRAMDFLLENGEAVQERVFFQVADLLHLEVDLVFFDTTSSYFEIEGEDEQEGVRRYGYSRDGRPDRAQVAIGMAVTKEGIPVRCWVFPGNTADAKTVARVKGDLHGWKLDQVIFVADRGMSSQENLRLLQENGGRYIIGERMRAGVSVVEEALSRPGRYRRILDNLEVKEVQVGRGKQAQRYVICRNLEEAERDQERREQLLQELEQALLELDQTAVHKRRACALRISRRFGRYVRQLPGGRLVLNRDIVTREERLDGKYLIRTSDKTLSTEEVALGYRQLLQVERGWRDLKQQLELRPMFHRKEDRIRSHVLLCFLGLLLIRVAENRTQTTWSRMRRELQRVCLVELTGSAGSVRQTSRLTDPQRQLFEALEVTPPSRIWAASSSRTSAAA
ncbi:MAG: IS1634 family transposase [Candidatus Dormibacteria bacterium]